MSSLDQETLREIIRTETLIEFAFEGHRYWDLRRWLVAHDYHNKPLRGWNVFEESEKGYYNNGNGPISVYDKNNFKAPRDYLFPIENAQVQISNVTQNPGW